MRTIKFRAWDKKNRRIYPVKSIAFSKDMIEVGDGYTGNIGRIEAFMLMQFTGLLDKNRKEIYEGDIVLDCCSDEARKVIYAAPAFIFDRHDKVGHSNPHSNCEVIGNIYENKELLN